MDRVDALIERVERSKAEYKKDLIQCLPEDKTVYRVVERYNMADTSIPWTAYHRTHVSLHLSQAGAAAAVSKLSSNSNHTYEIEAVAAESLSADELLQIHY